ncbi:hypothetical protein ACHWQZ_G005079 [Mnemiopsis leidyi]
MFVLYFFLIFVSEVTSQACQISSFEWKKTETSNTDLITGDKVIFSCAATSDLCAGTLKISGPDISNPPKFFDYKTELDVVLKTAGKQEYVCEYIHQNQVFQKSTVLSIQQGDCKITELSNTQKEDDMFEVKCTTSCKSDITLSYQDTKSVRIAAKGSQEILTTFILSSEGEHKVSCSMDVPTTGEKDTKEIILVPGTVCDISEMSLKNLVLYCRVSCEGQMELSGPAGWSSGVKNIGGGGGELEKEIPSSDEYIGKYRCKYTLTSGTIKEQTITVDPLCSTKPTISLSENLLTIGQKLQVSCKTTCGTTQLVLAEYDNPSLTGLKTTTSGSLEHEVELSRVGDVSFACFLQSDPNNLIAIRKVTVESCVTGDKWTECGTKCGIIFCSADKSEQEACLPFTESAQNCIGQCRCPDDKMYWKGDTSSGSCVESCDSGAVTDPDSLTSSWWIWVVVIPAIVIVVAAVVFIVRVCVKKKKRQKELIQEMKEVKEKKKSGQVTQNKTFAEEDSDPLYQDDIQYSQQSDQYYMHPDELIKPTPRTQSLPPPLPSAPIPTLERENEYNDPVLNPAIKVDQTTKPGTLESSEKGDETEYEGVAYNNIPGVVHTIRPGETRGGDGDEVLQIKFTDPSNIYVNNQ